MCANLRGGKIAAGMLLVNVGYQDTETELGLGVLIDVDERSVSIFIPLKVMRHVYMRNNAPLSRIIFNTNDEVQDQEGQKWIVESVEDRHGVLR